MPVHCEGPAAGGEYGVEEDSGGGCSGSVGGGEFEEEALVIVFDKIIVRCDYNKGRKEGLTYRVS